MEEASQVEGAEVETGAEVVESTGADTTTEETATDTTLDFNDVEADLATINLDGIRDKYGEQFPELAEFAKSLQADYTRKTQTAAAERKALDSWAKQLQEQYDQKLASLDPSNMPNFESLTPEQTANWLVQNITEQLQSQIDQRLGPVQDQMQAQQYDRIIQELESNNPTFADEMVRLKAAEIAGQGLTPEAALKAAAYDQLAAENQKLKSQQTKKTAAAIGQAGVSATDVATKPTDGKAMSWEEVKAAMRAKVAAGEL